MWYQGSFILSKFLNKGKLAYPVDWFPYPKVGSTKPAVSVFAESTYMLNKKSKNKDPPPSSSTSSSPRRLRRKMLELEGPFAANRSVRAAGLSPAIVRQLGKTIASYNKPTLRTRITR